MIVTIVVVSTLQVLFFENERLRLVDQRLETIASSLLASGLSLNMIQNLESTDDLISDLLGEERVDHIINVYAIDGKVLAQNFTALEFPLKFDKDEIHQTYEVHNQAVRVLNIKRSRLVVQVGALLGPGWLNRFMLINSRFVLFTLFVFALLVAAAYVSSMVLFRPLRAVTLELQSMSQQLERKLGQSLTGFVVGPEIARLAQRKDTRDEFELLCAEIEAFLKKLEGYTRSFHAQTAILTHELKTPLTVLRNYLEDLKRAQDMPKVKELGSGAQTEIDRLTRLINDYLQWSVLSSNPAQPIEIYAVKLSEVVQQAAGDHKAAAAGRLRVVLEGEVQVFALPDHVRQLVGNLLSNALNYSDKEVVCRVSRFGLSVEDQGTGIPEEVLKHLGSPFNRGDARRSGHRSSGLGLAWVQALCEKYGWQLAIESSPGATIIKVQFV
ncbi:MAG: HAMP domain-containing histidine kinase [Bdellovibrionales bacterium]|nr:HAMP domain-containing histidine kinase [Bdellovibrionales bacterium]